MNRGLLQTTSSRWIVARVKRPLRSYVAGRCNHQKNLESVYVPNRHAEALTEEQSSLETADLDMP